MDKNLVAALTKAYIARAKLFHTGVKASQLDLLIAEIDSIDGSKLNWINPELGVSAPALALLQKSGGTPHQVFAHPEVIKSRPHLICYYRNIVTISKKGIDQILFSTDTYESRHKESVSDVEIWGRHTQFGDAISKLSPEFLPQAHGNSR